MTTIGVSTGNILRKKKVFEMRMVTMVIINTRDEM